MEPQLSRILAHTWANSNNEHARAECILSVPPIKNLNPIAPDSPLECFADSRGSDRFRWEPVDTDSRGPVNGDNSDENDTMGKRTFLTRRQGCHTGIAQIQWPGVPRNPHKWRRHQQLTVSAITPPPSPSCAGLLTHVAISGLQQRGDVHNQRYQQQDYHPQRLSWSRQVYQRWLQRGHQSDFRILPQLYGQPWPEGLRQTLVTLPTVRRPQKGGTVR